MQNFRKNEKECFEDQPKTFNTRNLPHHNNHVYPNTHYNENRKYYQKQQSSVSGLTKSQQSARDNQPDLYNHTQIIVNRQDHKEYKDYKHNKGIKFILFY
jgi:hypothetical protein